MKLKLLISAGAVTGLLAVSAMSLTESYADEPEEQKRLAPQEKVLILQTEEPQTMKPQELEKPAAEEPQESEHQGMVYSRDWDAEESYLLAKIAMAEAGSEDIEGKALVICVVLNRTLSSKFPGSIEEVLYQENQFSPIADGGFNNVEPDQDCWDALLMVEQGWDESNGALYFESESRSIWHRDNLQFLFRHGNHLFYTDKEE